MSSFRQSARVQRGQSPRPCPPWPLTRHSRIPRVPRSKALGVMVSAAAQRHTGMIQGEIPCFAPVVITGPSMDIGHAMKACVRQLLMSTSRITRTAPMRDETRARADACISGDGAVHFVWRQKRQRERLMIAVPASLRGRSQQRPRRTGLQSHSRDCEVGVPIRQNPPTGPASHAQFWRYGRMT